MILGQQQSPLFIGGKKKRPLLGMAYTGVEQTGDAMMQDLAAQAPDQPRYVQLEEDIKDLEDPTGKEEKKAPTQEELDMVLKMAAQAAQGGGLPTGPFGTGTSMARQRWMSGFGRRFGA